MNIFELREYLQRGKTGIIPGWIGYLRYNYGKNEIYFQNDNYIMRQKELIDKIKDKTDLYYII